MSLQKWGLEDIKVTVRKWANYSHSPNGDNGSEAAATFGKLRYLKDHFRGMNPFVSIHSQHLSHPDIKVTQFQTIPIF